MNEYLGNITDLVVLNKKAMDDRELLYTFHLFAVAQKKE